MNYEPNEKAPKALNPKPVNKFLLCRSNLAHISLGRKKVRSVASNYPPPRGGLVVAMQRLEYSYW